MPPTGFPRSWEANPSLRYEEVLLADRAVSFKAWFVAGDGFLRATALFGILVACVLLWGCDPRQVTPTRVPTPDFSHTERVLHENELTELCVEQAGLELSTCWEILARLNTKDVRYIKEDLKVGNRLKVPNDFKTHSGYSPLPAYLPRESNADKWILIVKDIPFLGWYEQGRLVGDTHICIGKKSNWTKAGQFKVLTKDIDHVSKSYRSAYGYPALMPWALRIYGHVWIHGGDVVGGYCSHGCINLPLPAAETLFHWADPGTRVLIVESLGDLDRALAKGRIGQSKLPR